MSWKERLTPQLIMNTAVAMRDAAVAELTRAGVSTNGELSAGLQIAALAYAQLSDYSFAEYALQAGVPHETLAAAQRDCEELATEVGSAMVLQASEKRDRLRKLQVN